MAEAIFCRIKFAFLLTLFFLPIAVSMWSRYLDMQVQEASSLPPLTRFEYETIDGGSDTRSFELADVSD